MKIKFLSILSALAVITLMMTSCLKSDSEEVSLSTDTNVYAISIGQILGKDVPLTIDLKNARIFNREPLPFGSDTIINKTIFKSIRTTTGLLSRKDRDGNDTIFVYAQDTIDLTKDFQFTVHSMVVDVKKTYTVDIKYYQNDPEILNWKKIETDLSLGQERNLITQLDNQLFIYTPSGKGYKEGNKNWEEINVEGLPQNTIFTKLLADQAHNTLYILGSNKTIYQSNDGSTWTATEWGMNVEDLFVITPSSYLFAAKAANQDRVFAKIDLSQDDKTWESTEVKAPIDFPTKNISATFNTDKGTAFLIGQALDSETSTIWMSDSGQSWVKINDVNSTQNCPAFIQPQIFYYNNKLYAFDGTQKEIYSSIDGIYWNISKNKFLLPEEFNHQEAVVVVDLHQNIWLLEKSKNYIWKGILNLYNEHIKL